MFWGVLWYRNILLNMVFVGLSVLIYVRCLGDSVLNVIWLDGFIWDWLCLIKYWLWLFWIDGKLCFIKIFVVFFVLSGLLKKLFKFIVVLRLCVVIFCRIVFNVFEFLWIFVSIVNFMGLVLFEIVFRDKFLVLCCYWMVCWWGVYFIKIVKFVYCVGFLIW